LASHSNEKIERQWWHSLVRDVFSHVGEIRDFEAFFEELYDLFASPSAWHLYPETLEVLKDLKEKKGYIVGIISNWDSRLFKLCEGLGLNPCLDFILASAVFGTAKPGPRIFEEALRKSGIKAKEAIHVGDSLEDDVQGAQNVGIRAILIDRKSRKEIPLHEKFSQVRVIRNLKELLG
jgi:putative hydrolase of the HAD superfamily